jgi:hypothetical protein
MIGERSGTQNTRALVSEAVWSTANRRAVWLKSQSYFLFFKGGDIMTPKSFCNLLI